MSFYQAFKDLGIDAPFRSSGHAKCICPRCLERKGNGFREKSMELNFDNGYYQCHKANNCGWKGFAKNKDDKFSRPEWKNSTDIANWAVKYFEGRGISQDTLKKLKVTTDQNNNIVFNYFRHGQLINTKTRIERDGKKTFFQHKDAEKIFYNLDSIIGKKKVIIVEGEIDVLSWAEAGLPKDYGVISVDQGAPKPADEENGTKAQNADGKLECLTNCAELLNEVKEFYICTDKDAAGEYLQSELIRRLGEYRCNIVPLPDWAKDANDVFQNKDMSVLAKKETLILSLKSAQPAPVPGIQMLDQDVWDEMVHDYHNGDMKGSTTYFPELDEYYTFYPNEITLVTGIPGDGKGQVIRAFQINKSKFDGWKWACYVPEDMDAKFYFRDLCETYIGKPASKDFSNRMNGDEYSEAMEFVKKHFFIIEPTPDKETGVIPLPTNEWLNEKIRFLKLKYGVNAYVKDPWNKIYHDIRSYGREDQYLASELSKEKFFAKGFDAAIYVAHPTKLRKDMDGKYPCPTPYDISGGAMFYNMFDNCLTIYRPNKFEDPSDKTVEFHSFKIKKQKIVGTLGSAELKFDRFRNRYYQMRDGFNPLELDKPTNIPPPEPTVDFSSNDNGFVAPTPLTINRDSAPNSDLDDIPF